MITVDLKYIGLLSPYLRNFKRKEQYLFNCSCPICGDSKKNLKKARGFFYLNKNKMSYLCHNCGCASSIGSLIKRVAPGLYHQYKVDTFAEKENRKLEPPKIVAPEKKEANSINLSSIAHLPNGHYAKSYVLNREIPTDHLSNLYFAQNFSEFVRDTFPHIKKDLPSDARLIIPFYDEFKRLIGIQGRTFGGGLRYITLKRDDTVQMIYGMDRHQPGKTYVVEGPLDSLFLPNSLAVAGSNLKGFKKTYKYVDDCVLVFDNQNRNSELLKIMAGAIAEGFKICIWPSTIKEKDINQMFLAGMSQGDIIKTIDDNTFKGIKAKLKFNDWKGI